MQPASGIWEYTNQYEWLKRTSSASLPPLIITVAITGGAQGKEINPTHPETAEEQAAQTYECYKLGASQVHIHVRNPDNPAQSSGDPAIYKKVNGLIREKCPDIIINNTTGGGEGMHTEEERLGSLDAKPEIASLDMGPLAFRGMLRKRQPPLSGRPNDIPLDAAIPITFHETEVFAKRMLEKGIKPEMEVFQPGMFWLVQNLIEKKLVQPPYYIQFCMGTPSGAHPTPKNLIHMLELAPTPSVFSVLGTGHQQTIMMTMGILLGINVRTGMEDNVLARPGELCKGNVQLVEKVVRLARELDRPIATPKQARQILGISETPTRY